MSTTLTCTQGITRFEYHRTCGWLARYYALGCVIQRLFSDSRYGYDEERSHAAAKAFLRECATNFPPRPHFRTNRTARARPERHIGVCLVTKRERSGAHVRMWSVNYVVGGQRKTKTFRLHHFPSVFQAYQTAVLFRQAQELAMYRERHEGLKRLWAEE